MFSFDNLLRVEFSDNQLNNIKPINDLDFYSKNSVLYKKYGRSVKNIDGMTFDKKIENISNSSAIINAQNVYEMTIVGTQV